MVDHPISVIMPIHDGTRTLERAIRGLQKQTNPDWELIGVDDAESVETLRSGLRRSLGG